MSEAYFQRFETRVPPKFQAMTAGEELRWQFGAGMTVAAGLWYLMWRWGHSMNPEALWFSTLVALAETLFFFGTMLFFFDIWREGDTPSQPAPAQRHEACLDGETGPIGVDIFVTTFDEGRDVVLPSIEAACQVYVPRNVRLRIYLLDDGARPEMASLAQKFGVTYLRRDDNVGFKAGNLRNALFRSSGDFLVICDADTRLFSTFLVNTLGYFRDPKVAWVQTPHWFYDIPEGIGWKTWLAHRGFHRVARLARALSWISGKPRVGSDPFFSEPALFFDIIQRRRNRHGASFCCGAGSVHRRDAIFDRAMKRKAADIDALTAASQSASIASLSCVPLEPYRFHVSEDIYTSILMHGDAEAGWRSVYHPQVEARMLSPWSLNAWATQRLKYAGGTFDIFFRDNPIFSAMPWRTKVHYGATFWSYLSVLWAPVLLLAPAVSLAFGISPVEAYSVEFFIHFLPVILLAELTMLATCKGHSLGAGRTLALAALPLNLRALIKVLQGKSPRFPPTPKRPGTGGAWHIIWPNACLVGVMVASSAVGIVRAGQGAAGYSAAMLWVNGFWLMWNIGLLMRVVMAAFWKPETELMDQSLSRGVEVSNEYASTTIA